MAAAVGLRTDFTSETLRTLARQSRDAKQARRLLALAVIYDEAVVQRRQGMAASAFKYCAIGFFDSTLPPAFICV